MIKLRRVERWVQDGNPASSEKGGELKRFMVGSVPLAEWYVEAEGAGRSLGNTTWALALNLLAFGSLLPLFHHLDRSAQAVGSKQPGVCDSQEQKSRNSAPFGKLRAGS